MYPCHIGLLMSLPEGAETLQNNIAQLCELWYVNIMTNAIDSIPWLSYIIWDCQQMSLLVNITIHYRT